IDLGLVIRPNVLVGQRQTSAIALLGGLLHVAAHRVLEHSGPAAPFRFEGQQSRIGIAEQFTSRLPVTRKQRPPDAGVDTSGRDLSPRSLIRYLVPPGILLQLRHIYR